MRGPSLGARISIVAIASAVLAVLIAGVVSYPLVRDATLREATANLEKLADATAAAIERVPLRQGDVIPDRLAAVLSSEEITFYYVAPDGQLPDGLSNSDIIVLATGQVISGERTTARGKVFIAGRPLSSGAALVLTQPVTVTGELAIAALSRFGLALGVGAAFAAVFGLLLARRITRTLRHAANAAMRLSTGDRDVALEVDGPREIAELCIALNQLQSALSVSEGRQRHFLLSISHELRTPLTAIRGYSEAIADGVVAPQDLAKTGDILQSEADRLDRLVADLLELARLDAVDFLITPTTIDFLELGRQAELVWSDRCAGEGLTLRVELPQGPLIGRSDPIRVRQIIDNLCANALRMTPAGQVVVIAIRPVPNDVGAGSGGVQYIELEVRDSGPGLTPDDCAVAFEPAELYSRYRGIRQVGTGIGLALVSRLANRLGGGARASAAPEGGACFTITIARSIV